MVVSRRFLRACWGRVLTTMSWSLVLGLSGCSDTVRIGPARTPELVKAYSERRESVLWYRWRLYAIREEQRARLHVVTARRWKTAGGPAGSAPGWWTTRPVDVALSAVRAEGDVLYFPGEQPLRVGDLQRVELGVDGEAPDGVRRGRPRPDRHAWSYRRFALGLAAGGTSFGQMVLRVRVVGPVLIDLGALALGAAGGFGANGSAGLVLELPVARRWSVFAGGGVGGAGYVAGGGNGSAAGGRAYFYGRGGIAARLGLDERDQLGLEGAVWSGKESQQEDTEGPSGMETSTRSARFVWPVPGIFWLHTL